MFRKSLTLALLLIAASGAHGQAGGDPLALWERATVYRDAWGTPHVYAADPYALAFAFGHAQAEDHLGGMLMAYRIASGTAAEVAGEGLAESDELALKAGHAELAAEAFPDVSPLTRDLCEGFALGVNTWMIDHPTETPAWAEGVRGSDILALWHYFLMSHAPLDHPGAPPRPRVMPSANAWAMAPERTTAGRAILAINPHCDYTGPFLWYEAHLACGALDVAGATLFGLPVILQGHNASLGWALSPNEADFADVYMQVEAELPEKLKDPRLRRAQKLASLDAIMARSIRRYQVRTDAGMEEREAPVYLTPQGPIIGRYGGHWCTWRVAGYGDFGGLEQVYGMGCARDLHEFQDALSMRRLPCFHIVYADKQGTIFYLYNASVHEKADPVPAPEPPAPPADAPLVPSKDVVLDLTKMGRNLDWQKPVLSTLSQGRWGPPVPAQAMPGLTNPPAGFIQASGTTPWKVTADCPLKPGDWPSWLVQDVHSFRADRTLRVLSLGTRSFEEAQAILYDVVAPLACNTVPRLLAAADKAPEWVAQAHPDLPAALGVLRDWSCVAEPSSTGMTLFHVWWAAVQSECPPGWTLPQFLAGMQSGSSEAEEVALRAADRTARLMRSEYNSLEVPWGAVHRARRGDRDEPMPGAVAGEPVLVSADRNFVDGAWVADYGYGFGMVVEFGDMPRAVSMVPFGASENPESPHFSDQLDLMTKRRFKPAVYRYDDVLRRAESGYGRQIRLGASGAEAMFTVRARVPVSASVETLLEPPAPLPATAGTFSLFVRLNQRPTAVRTDIEIEMHVPAEVCAPKHLDQLAVYAYDHAGGWTPLDAQRLDARTQTLLARDRTNRIYAVLGPKELRPGYVSPKKPPDQQPPEPADSGAERVNAPLIASGERARAEEPAPSPEPEQTPARPAPRKPGPPVHPGSESSAAPPPRLGAVAWGTDLRLRPPGLRGEFRVTATSPVGVRLLASTETDTLLPDGTAAFSEFVSLDCSEPSLLTGIDVVFCIDPAVCNPSSIIELRVYALTDKGVWAPLEKQQVDEAAAEVRAYTTQASSYVVLGPEKLRGFRPGL